jgi:tRNA-modifying protein YgfZ
MWQSFQTFQEHPVWGLHRRSLAEEAADQQAGTPLAACISTLELIRVGGADAETFLQGQTTCDFREIAQGGVRLGAHCNAKGRVQASFYAVKQQDDFILLLPKGQGEPTRAALAKYAMFSKVSLTLETAWLPLALLGSGIDATTAKLWGSAPAEGACVSADCGLLANTGNGMLLALVPADKAAALLQSLQDAGISLAGDNPWWLAQLSAGIAQILPQQSEAWIPQEFNYDLVNGVSFKKGCYKGQEIVARIHYRGQTKVRARVLEIQGVASAEPGTRIVNDAGQNTGTLLQAAFVNEHTLLGLGVIKTDISESEPLRLEPNESSRVRLAPMPYAITN